MQRDGQGRLESETLSGQGMGKFQPARVQRQTSTRIQRGAITLITDDVTAEAGQMNSDLVLATGFQTHFDERKLPARLRHAIMSDRQSAAWRRAVIAEHMQGPGLGERTSDRAALRLGTSDHDFLVALFHFRPSRPQLMLGLHGLGEQHQAGRLAIESMDDQSPLVLFDCLLRKNSFSRTDKVSVSPPRAATVRSPAGFSTTNRAASS
jgi:hypothetical protein